MKLNKQNYMVFIKIWMLHFLLYSYTFFYSYKSLFESENIFNRLEVSQILFAPIIGYTFGMTDYFLCFPLILIFTMFLILESTKIKMRIAYIISVFIPTALLSCYHILVGSDVIWPSNNVKNSYCIILLKFVSMFFVFFINWLVFRKSYAKISGNGR
ncbi:MAG: hypothetical protein EAZ53_12780 [Bacteroidetes bacterium]|nr:MAG: hypothetical protein EAZ53_12780 [Bacteroidota bacterium]